MITITEKQSDSNKFAQTMDIFLKKVKSYKNQV